MVSSNPLSLATDQTKIGFFLFLQGKINSKLLNKKLFIIILFLKKKKDDVSLSK